MPETFTLSQIVITAIGSIGGLTGLISAAVAINKILTERRKVREQRQRDLIHDTIEGRRLDLEHSDRKEADALAAVWKIVDRLEHENEDIEKLATLTRPTIVKIARNLREMRKEIESLNLMILDEKETNVFMRRFQRVKELLDETENILP